MASIFCRIWGHSIALGADADAGAGIGVGNIFGNFLSGALRNPSAAGSQIGNLFVGAALAEALGILSFVIGILLWTSAS